jgi:hypothetical protein
VAKKRSKSGGCRGTPRELGRPSSNPCRQVAAEIDQPTRDLTEWGGAIGFVSSRRDRPRHRPDDRDGRRGCRLPIKHCEELGF